MHKLSSEQAQRLLRAVAGDRMQVSYTQALFMGMRLGEMLALHWADVGRDAMTPQGRSTIHHPQLRRCLYWSPCPKPRGHSLRTIAPVTAAWTTGRVVSGAKARGAAGAGFPW
jgi:integrase